MSNHPSKSIRVLSGASFLVLLSALAYPGCAATASGDVYVLSNQSGGNSVMVYHRDAHGALTFSDSFASGGNGSGSGADPLGSQNPVVLSDDGKFLFAVNAGSDSITAFKIHGDRLKLVNTVSSSGTMPVSLAVRKNLVYVLNAGGTPNISGFIVNRASGALAPLSNSTEALPGGMSAAPAEVAFANHEPVLAVTEKGTNAIDTFVLSGGVAQAGNSYPSAAETPFGFAFGKRDVAIVSDAVGGGDDASELSSYRVTRSGDVKDITAGAGDNQTGACWVVVTRDGKYAFTSNTGSGTISSYHVSNTGALSLQNVSAGAAEVPVDMGMTSDSRFLYTRDAGDGMIIGFGVKNGALTQMTSAAGLPSGAAGLAAR